MDKINFNQIGEISGICGSKFEKISYSFEHPNPIKNRINYYRLALGGLGFSDTISIEILDFKYGYQVRPNPMKMALSKSKELYPNPFKSQ